LNKKAKLKLQEYEKLEISNCIKNTNKNHIRTQSVDQYILETFNLAKPKNEMQFEKVLIDSPTKKLIKFQEKRLADKKEIAKRSHNRSFDNFLVYSNKPKINFKTSIQKLEELKNTEKSESKKEDIIKNEIEKNLAVELLPILKEKMLKMYFY